MSGSCSASWASAARSEPCSSGVRAKTTASSAGRGKRPSPRRRPAAHRSRRRPGPRRGPGSSPSRPPTTTSRRGAPAGAKTRIEVAFASSPPPTAHALARTERAREQAGVRDAFAGGRPLDLEDAARHRRLRIAARAAEELVDARRAARRRRSRARPSRRTRDGRARAASASASCSRRRGPDSACLVADEGPEDRLVVLGEDLGERRPMGRVVGAERHDGRRRGCRDRGRSPSARPRARADASSPRRRVGRRRRPGRSC